MALACGHRTDPATRRELVEAGLCPGCPSQPLMPQATPVPSSLCACCGTRWVLLPDRGVGQFEVM